MRYLSFFLLFTLWFGRLGAQSNTAPGPGSDQISGTLTLRQAVDIAMKNNLSVNQQDLNSQGYKIAYDQSWEFMLPTLNASGGQSINFGRSISSVNNSYSTTQFSGGNAGLNSNLVLFKGLAYQNGVKAARYAYDASKLDLQAQKDNITLNVLLGYLQVLSNRDQLALALEQAQVDSANLERLKLQNESGALSPISNLTDLQGQYAGDMVNIANNINALESSKVSLFNLLNIPYNRNIEYQNSVTTADMGEYPAAPDSIFQTALRIMPTVRSAQLKLLQYQKALAQAKGAFWPTISLQASVGTNWTNAPSGNFFATDSSYQPVKNIYAANGAAQYQLFQQQYSGYTTFPNWGTQFKNNRGETFGLSVSIPILNGFQVRNNVRNARLNVRTSELNNNYARNQLQQAIENAFQNMIAAYKSYKFYIDQAKAYEESFRITNLRFTEGVITSDVYLQAKNRNDAAEVNLAAAKYIYIFRTKVMDYYQGKLQIN